MKKIVTLLVGGLLVIGVVVVIALNRGESVGNGRTSGDSSVEGQGQTLEELDTGDEGIASKTDRPRVSSEENTVVGTDSDKDKRRRMMSQFSNSMKTQNEAKAARLIEKLVADLNLSAEQKAELEEYFAKQVEAASAMFGGGSSGGDRMAAVGAMAALNGKGLGEVMEGLLTPEQEEMWSEREEKRFHRVADSNALQDLAGLNSVIEVRENQRDAIYEHFYQKNLASESDASTGGVLGAALGGITEGLGIEFDAGSIMGADFSEIARESRAADGQVDVAALLQRQREQQIESQVSDLEPILDERQLQDYRESLESRGSLLDGLMNVSGGGPLSASPVSVQTFVVPASE